ncbi:hypothetical protein E2C01_046086 [Portunus trituberculatus]|uniref:Uncharacterized protein n=1 Tax=Portunus trituberculatus TaxID=210409 RepID=A0A5B7G4M9_PORTR|nr:hypothetical protein [Portunus trituberculatus]
MLQQNFSFPLFLNNQKKNSVTSFPPVFPGDALEDLLSPHLLESPPLTSLLPSLPLVSQQLPPQLSNLAANTNQNNTGLSLNTEENGMSTVKHATENGGHAFPQM